MSSSDMLDVQLIDQCRKERELSSLQQKQMDYVSACLELLRRGVAMWSPQAFEAVHGIYGRLFVSWVVAHNRYDEFCNYMPHFSPDDVVQIFYLKMHRALQNRDDFHIKFKSVAYFMAYSRSTLSNCINDYLPRKPKPTVGKLDVSSNNSSLSGEKNLVTSPRRLPPTPLSEQLTITDQETSNASKYVDQALDWERKLAYLKSTLTEAEYLVLQHKLYERPDLDTLLNMGMTSNDVKKIWRTILAKLHTDPKFLKLLDPK